MFELAIFDAAFGGAVVCLQNDLSFALASWKSCHPLLPKESRRVACTLSAHEGTQLLEDPILVVIVEEFSFHLALAADHIRRRQCKFSKHHCQTGMLAAIVLSRLRCSGFVLWDFEGYSGSGHLLS